MSGDENKTRRGIYHFVWEKQRFGFKKGSLFEEGY